MLNFINSISAIKDFEGLASALAQTRGLNLHKHDVIAKKLERDLLTHLKVKEDESNKILEDERELLKDTEGEAVRGEYIHHFFLKE